MIIVMFTYFISSKIIIITVINGLNLRKGAWRYFWKYLTDPRFSPLTTINDKYSGTYYLL